MNIKRAKEEIKQAIHAYLLKDEFGEYRIPSIRQRPILLIGPPGIGKTQIMEQISRECGINLVAYTITHHTRQSAIGLPFIREKSYGGQTYCVTEYTMSEIIASVYEKIEKTGITEGILFIDEINCVSETLAPAMLQFLQYKTFGNQAVPSGWIIVAAGNPPEYNKSVRDFDLVTLDRLKRIDVEADFSIWKEYAYKQGIHGAVISYLDTKPDCFYKIETTIDGKEFATARGWEDLSELIQVYEALHQKIDREVVHQYIQHWTIAKDFANYLELFYRYQEDYQVDEILLGHVSESIFQRLKFASFDERLSLVSLLFAHLAQKFRDCYLQELFVTLLFGYLKQYKTSLMQQTEHIGHFAASSTFSPASSLAPSPALSPAAAFLALVREVENIYAQEKQSEQLGKVRELAFRRVLSLLHEISHAVSPEMLSEEAFDCARTFFAREESLRQQKISDTKSALDSAFLFMERAFGESQEMVCFVTELNIHSYASWFIRENGCDLYYRYNKGLLLDARQQDILADMEAIEKDLPDAVFSLS